MNMTVHLADLRHDYGGALSTDCMPLGIGFMKAVMDRAFSRKEVQSRLFAYPATLIQAMEERPPEALMVSNYVWNENLGRACLRHLANLAPAALRVMGGPNIPQEPERQMAFLRQHPEIDLYICGEGDFLATEIIEAFLDCGQDKQALFEKDLPSCIYRRPDGTVVYMETRDRQRDVNQIPSPWLTGIMDGFFDGKLAPMIETNRGCPFRCSFCVQGTSYYTKVNYFDLERMREEIRYIARINHERSPHMGTLRIADPNYGMYERDVEISSCIGEVQKIFGWPTFIDATTGKNRAERIIESMEKVNGALVLYQAVQSLDETVLRNINRSNIKLETYQKLQVHVRGRGLRSTSDLILGLPGESKASHLDGLFKLIDAGTNQAHCFQAMMLKGSELDRLETREKYSFRTAFRVLPKNFGLYAGEKVFDVEEIIVETDTMTFEDYIECRKHHLAFSIFWNDSWFEDLAMLARRFGALPSEWLQAMLRAMTEDLGPVHDLLVSFAAETRGELFETKQECIDFYSEYGHFEQLRNGEIGDNLMYKYRAQTSFFLWNELCNLAGRATRKMLLERESSKPSEGFEAFFDDLLLSIQARHAAGRSFKELRQPLDLKLSHDIEAWRTAGRPRHFAPYKLKSPQRFRFRLSPKGERELEAAFKVWSARLTGLTKLVTRIRINSQVRTCTLLDPVMLPPA